MYTTSPQGYLLLISGSLGFLIVFIMGLKKRPASYYFFSAGLLIKSSGAIMLALIKTQLILDVPNLFLLPAPFQYLLGPACLYFVLLSINPHHKFKWWETIHLIPFLLHLYELMPFYFSDTAVKLSRINNSYQNDSQIGFENFGLWLPYFQHLLIKACFTFSYALISLWLLWKNYAGAMDAYRKHNLVLYKWVALELTLKLMVETAVMIKSYWSEGSASLDTLLTLTLVTDMVVSFGFIVLNPAILEGTKPYTMAFPPLDQSNPEITVPKPDAPSEHHTSPADNISEVPRWASDGFALIENYFQSNKPFIKDDFTKDNLSAALRIPARKISDIIKLATGMSFTDYVNLYRIHFLEETLPKRSDWHKFTIDALASEVGFANRITFYNATKRHRNMTPSELLISLNMATTAT